jgi:hypothetical protein
MVWDILNNTTSSTSTSYNQSNSSNISYMEDVFWNIKDEHSLIAKIVYAIFVFLFSYSMYQRLKMSMNTKS